MLNDLASILWGQKLRVLSQPVPDILGIRPLPNHMDPFNANGSGAAAAKALLEETLADGVWTVIEATRRRLRG